MIFLASVQHVPGCIIQRGDCGEGGLALLSFHVITGHIRINARNAELWITLNLEPQGCCKWDPDLDLNSRRCKQFKCGIVCGYLETFPPSLVERKGRLPKCILLVRPSKAVIHVSVRNAKHLKRICWLEQGVRYQRRRISRLPPNYFNAPLNIGFLNSAYSEFLRTANASQSYRWFF